jgi:hypothetical protein
MNLIIVLHCLIKSIEKKQPSSRVEKIYVKTSFNIPFSSTEIPINYLHNKSVLLPIN